MKISHLVLVNLCCVLASSLASSRAAETDGEIVSPSTETGESRARRHRQPAGGGGGGGGGGEERRTPRRKRAIVKRDATDRSSLEIYLETSIAIEVIDGFKEEYALDFVGRSWAEADALFPRGCLNDAYLPPSQLLPYSSIPYLEELPRSYGLMQHCLVSLENLIVDHIHLKEYKFLRQLNDVFLNVVQILDYLKRDMEVNRCQADNAKTQSLTSMVYQDANGALNQRKRSFVILRDVKVSLDYVKDTFPL
ncbi:uncharacterized protein LOC135212414 [Macrobrachium nipponense]|uniref:uncharacterized protein LOC135212414 n=1 Tax=Macrobrachium nipponense TaxID=159736 RepID=UPI0030C865D9